MDGLRDSWTGKLFYTNLSFLSIFVVVTLIRRLADWAEGSGDRSKDLPRFDPSSFYFDAIKNLSVAVFLAIIAMSIFYTIYNDNIK